MPQPGSLARAVAGRLSRGAGVPLVALRIPALEAIAWRDGRRAARVAERCVVTGMRATGVLRAGDAFAHRSGSDRFAVALLAPPRNGGLPAAADARLALVRIVAAAARSTGHHVQGGWWTLRRRDELECLGATIDAALERGMRERERGELLATFGHELRTPLGAIGGYLETLLDGGIDPATARRFLQTARRETLRLGRMAEGLMAISLLDAPAAHDGTCCDVAAVVAECLEALAPRAQRCGIAVRTSVAGECVARIGADACMQALSNVLDNALKWASTEVRIDCSHSGRAATVHVDDDGPGIAPEERERVFAMGVRDARSGRGGAGIGLAIVRAVVRRSGGDAFVVTSPLGGARVVVRLAGEA